jgi:hypothetical protein
MEANYHKALDKYYNYKKKYADDREKQKQKIKDNSNLSVTEKKKKIEQIRQRCLFCNRKVGMSFSKSKQILYASCGDQQAPCEKKIEIKTGFYMQLEETIQYMDSEIKQDVEAIINDKTKLLLNIGDKDDIIASFEDRLEVYNYSQEIYNRLLARSQNYQLDKKSEDFVEFETELKGYVEKIKEISEQYNKLGIKDNKLLTEISTIYKDNILPLEEKMNEYRYKNRDVIFENKLHYLKQYNIILKDTEVVNSDDPEVLRFDPPK